MSYFKIFLLVLMLSMMMACSYRAESTVASENSAATDVQAAAARATANELASQAPHARRARADGSLRLSRFQQF